MCNEELPLIQPLIAVKIGGEGLEVYGRVGKSKDYE